MHGFILLQDLAIVMAISAFSVILCHRIRLPVVLGYILAGIIIGPYTPPHPLVTDMESINVLSDLGIMLLLFSIGLEFSLKKLFRVGLVAFAAATVEILLMLGIGFGVGRGFGWNLMDSIFLGAILSISSTTIIAKLLIDMKIMEEKFAQVILGILVVEDLLAIVLIAMLSAVASPGDLSVGEALTATLKGGGFIAVLLAVGFLLIPWLLRYVAKFKIAEMLMVTVLGLCFSVAVLAAHFGFSIALGAFLIGAIIAETPEANEIIHKIEPIRDMFTAIFFVSVGLAIDPAVLLKFSVPILVITLVTILGKIASCSLATRLTGYNMETSLKVGLGLAQIGEFSFIIARLGDTKDVTSPFLYSIAVSVSALTTISTPFLMKNTPAILRFLKRIPFFSKGESHA
jgi:CPA2 family monovalent cation:H+ antiporter-2